MVPRKLFNPSLGKVRSYAIDEKLHIGPLNSVTIGEDRIEWVKHTRRLGVTTDNRLSWSHHLADVKKRILLTNWTSSKKDFVLEQKCPFGLILRDNIAISSICHLFWCTADAKNLDQSHHWHCGLEWFNGRWSPLQLSLLIAYKELVPVVLAGHVWGPRWSRRRILLHVHNEAVVHILNSRASKDPNIMHLPLSLLKDEIQG